jgi:MFS family permease
LVPAGVRSGRIETVVPSLVWVLLAGNGVASLLRFLVLPFLALYLHRVTGASPAAVGGVIGLAALSSLAAGFFLGGVSDRAGRRPVLVAGTVLLSAVYAGYGLAHDLATFAVLQVLAGLAYALTGPTLQALLADLTPPALRLRVFGYSYWAINVGAAVGPLVASLMGAGRASRPFLVAGLVLALAAGALWAVLPPAPEPAAPGQRRPRADLLPALAEAARHPVLGPFLLASFCGSLAYVQAETNLAVYVGTHTALGAHLFAAMMAANGLTVIALQPFITRWQEGRPLVVGATLGGLGFALASLLYLLAGPAWSWVAVHVLFSVAEVLLSPTNQTVVAELAPADARAQFFNLPSLVYGIGSALGPTLGGLALGIGGGAGLFMGMALANGLSAALYRRALGGDPRFARASRGQPVA